MQPPSPKLRLCSRIFKVEIPLPICKTRNKICVGLVIFSATYTTHFRVLVFSLKEFKILQKRGKN